eukprot:m.57749 g.57749  ORF g.57749 m.57749 type:complete len:489 (-) comp11129_c0_seq1:1057-2523(-)
MYKPSYFWGRHGITSLFIVLLATALGAKEEDYKQESCEGPEAPIESQEQAPKQKWMDVTVKDWDDAASFQEFIEEIAEQREPVIFRNSPLSQWEAINASCDEIAAIAPYIEFERLENPIYTYADESMAKMRDVEVDGKDNLQTMMVNVKRVCEHLNSSTHYYYSNRLAASPLKSWGQDRIKLITNMTKMQLRMNKDVPGFPQNELIQLWMGTNGATTKMHYDVFDNFYVQIKGIKEFIIAESKFHPILKIYPLTHPNARQSQLNFALDGDLNVDSILETMQKSSDEFTGDPVQVHKVTLYPGDVFFQPAFTMHMVRAVSPGLSISANAFSASVSTKVGLEMIQKGFPDELDVTVKDVDMEPVTKRLVVFLDMMEAQLLPDGMVPRFVTTLFKSRFDPLAKRFDLGCVCDRHMARSLHVSASERQHYEIIMQESITKLQSMLNTLPVKPWVESVREILVDNYAEMLITSIFKDNACEFLACLEFIQKVS